jgi:hypothetical protein
MTCPFAIDQDKLSGDRRKSRSPNLFTKSARRRRAQDDATDATADDPGGNHSRAGVGCARIGHRSIASYRRGGLLIPPPIRRRRAGDRLRPPIAGKSHPDGGAVLRRKKKRDLTVTPSHTGRGTKFAYQIYSRNYFRLSARAARTLSPSSPSPCGGTPIRGWRRRRRSRPLFFSSGGDCDMATKQGPTQHLSTDGRPARFSAFSLAWASRSPELPPEPGQGRTF